MNIINGQNFSIRGALPEGLPWKAWSFLMSYREGQESAGFGGLPYHDSRTAVFIQAPTGIGKTMAAVVFPSVRAVGAGFGDKIFYLTAKTITRTVAEEAFEILKKRGLSYKTLTITAKEKLCLSGRRRM